MPLLKKWTQQDAIFGIWQITEPFEWFRSHLNSDIPYDAELQQFKSPKRKLEYVATRILLRELCGKEIAIGHHDSGKPYVADGGTFITISHTQNYIAAGICPSSDIGIDIEYRSDRITKIQNRFLSNKEKDWCLAASSLSTAITRMLICWTAKESLYKILNKKGIDFSNDIAVIPFAPTKGKSFMASESTSQAIKKHLLFYESNDKFVCTWTISDITK